MNTVLSSIWEWCGKSVFSMNKMSKLYIYDIEGDINEEPIESEYNIFRKVIDLNIPDGKTELEIAKKILKCPMRNVVRIYDVHDEMNGISWIDMEYLENDNKLISVYLEDFKQGIKQLHSLGVVYIDIKEDNIGYSHIDRVYKIFDFNCSGIVDTQSPKEWKKQPYNNSFKYRELKERENSLNSLYELDSLSFEMEYKQKFS